MPDNSIQKVNMVIKVAILVAMEALFRECFAAPVQAVFRFARERLYNPGPSGVDF
jgi:hypothetical protein